jgi:ferric-dicitrate binding protein FerR (iron transport regulator)
MLASEIADSPSSEAAPAPSSRRRILRRVLVVAVVVLVLGIVLFAAMSGLAADPMTGT